jgi:deoxyribonuclease IV
MKGKRGSLLGAHMSIAGGIHNAFGHGERAGCRALQVFLKNSNQWQAKPLTDQDAALYEEARVRSGIHPVIAHSSYLINLASPEPELNRKSREAFAEELRRANFLGIPWVVIHPGAHMGAGESSGIRLVAQALQWVLDLVEPPAGVLLENTAGQGTTLGRSFEQLAAILEGLRENARVGVCLDTCHLFAAGYDIRTRETYGKTLAACAGLVGIDRVRAFHLNDSRRELGSRVDRHEHIGKGHIGLEAFRVLLNDKRFDDVPKVLETPKGQDLKEDIENLRLLRGLMRRPGER